MLSNTHVHLRVLTGTCDTHRELTHVQIAQKFEAMAANVYLTKIMTKEKCILTKDPLARLGFPHVHRH